MWPDNCPALLSSFPNPFIILEVKALDRAQQNVLDKEASDTGVCSTYRVHVHTKNAHECRSVHVRE